MPTATVQMHIDLSGIAGRVQRILKQLTYMTSIGVRATDAITPESLQMPEVSFVFLYDHSNPWTPEEAKAAWRQWVLTNAFRDIAEIVSGTLEEAQGVLAIWSLLDPGAKGTAVKAEEWNKIVAHRAEQFHRRTLPQKFEFLREAYGFCLQDEHVCEVLSINAARNCLVHRGGQVTRLDVDSTGALTLRWRQMIPYVEIDGKEEELILPFFAEKDTTLSIKVEAREKTFATNDVLEITLAEFSGISWTLFTFAQHVGQSLEAHGREKGFEIGTRAP